MILPVEIVNCILNGIVNECIKVLSLIFFSICKCQNGHSQIVAFGTNQGTFLLSLLLSAYWDKVWRPSSDPHMSCRQGSSLWCFLSSLEVWYSEIEEWGRLSDISSKEIFVSAFHNISISSDVPYNLLNYSHTSTRLAVFDPLTFIRFYICRTWFRIG